VKKSVHSYKLKIMDTKDDAPTLQSEIGLVNGYLCPFCKSEMVLELFPDYVRNEGHWFTAHFVCHKCGKAF